MVMRFSDIGSFVAHAKTLPGAVRRAQRTALQTVSKELKVEIQGSLGTYQPGWRELAHYTKEQRLKKGWSENDPLDASGALKASIGYKTSNVRAVIGAASPHARAMELGEPDKHVPARPFLAPPAYRKSVHIANAVGRRVAYALASQTPPTTTTPTTTRDDP